MDGPRRRFVCLTNVYDQHYHDWRGERVARSLSQAKRRDLFRCLELALGAEALLLSSHPPALDRRSGRWLSAVETRFSTHRQLFCAVWDRPKLRIPFTWVSYALHVFRHTRPGDVVFMDNYEWLYVLAAWPARLLHRARFVLDYEDGKHLIDRGWLRCLSGLAEVLGKPLICAALLAHPRLGDRLKRSLPTELVPGFVVRTTKPKQRLPGGPVRFLYSGGLDGPRGIDIVLDALPFLPDQGWHLDVTGEGPLASAVTRAAGDPRWTDRVHYHGALPTDAYEALLRQCHVGLNCQRASDRISSVTFPSKVFTYLSAGLLVLSSRASQVDKVCGAACRYYDSDKPEALAAAMVPFIHAFPECHPAVAGEELTAKYSIEGTVSRVRDLLRAACLI